MKNQMSILDWMDTANVNLLKSKGSILLGWNCWRLVETRSPYFSAKFEGFLIFLIWLQSCCFKFEHIQKIKNVSF